MNKSIRSGGQCSPPRRGWGWPGRSPPGPAVTCELFSIHPLSSTPNRLWEMNPQAHTVPGEWQCIQCAVTWGVQDRQTPTPPLSVSPDRSGWRKKLQLPPVNQTPRAIPKIPHAHHKHVLWVGRRGPLSLTSGSVAGDSKLRAVSFWG